MPDGGRSAEVSYEPPTPAINPTGYRDHRGSASCHRCAGYGDDFVSRASPSRSPASAQPRNRSASNFSFGHRDNGGRRHGDRSDSDGDLLPDFRTSPRMISSKERGRFYVEEQSHGSADDRALMQREAGRKDVCPYCGCMTSSITTLPPLSAVMTLWIGAYPLSVMSTT